MTGKRGAEASPGAPVIRTVRILKKDETIRPIRGGSAWVKPGNTHHICLFEIPGRNGKKDTRDMVSVSMIEAVRRIKAGLPVISEETAGTPEVVENGRTGLLTPARDTGAFARAIATLAFDAPRRADMAAAARRFARGDRGLDTASRRLDTLLQKALRP